MNYQRHYGLLIERARARTLQGYSELHHIKPKCLGGTDATDNLVKLTAEEHFVAHQLLVKLHPESKNLAYAALLMTTDCHKHRIHNKAYGWIKRRVAEAKSIEFSGRTWTKSQNEARAEKVRAQWADPDFRAARKKAMTGRVWPEASKAARSKAMKGLPIPGLNGNNRAKKEISR